jgi:hypothetical protein
MFRNWVHLHYFNIFECGYYISKHFTSNIASLDFPIYVPNYPLRYSTSHTVALIGGSSVHKLDKSRDKMACEHKLLQLHLT